jgi:hypothetical protein
MNETTQQLTLMIYHTPSCATFYDASNGVGPSSLQPGQRAPFDITASERTMPTYLIASYTLSADHLDFD